MALEPKYEEARDIRVSVVESRLEEILRRRLAGKGLIIDVKAAPKPDPRIAGPRPRGSKIIRKPGLLGKKLGEFHATGAWTIAPEFEAEFAPVRKELESRFQAAVMRRNADRLRGRRGPVVFEETGVARAGFYDIAATLYEMAAEIAEAEAEGLAAKAEGLKVQLLLLETKLKAMREYSNDDWKRDLIPG